MRTDSHVSLLPYNTFGIETSTELLLTLGKEDDIEIAFKSYPKGLIIGGGSNILLSKPSYDVVILNLIKGIEVIEETSQEVIVSVGSGEDWHQVVMWTIEHNFGGLENLSLIPGTAGAAPIQNIGAYGVELKDVLHGVDYYKFSNHSLRFVPTEECDFGYRDSVFKNELKNKGFISRIFLRLTKEEHKINTSYHALEQYLKNQEWFEPTINQISQAVMAIRQSKLPDWRKIGNAGSFFKNPVVSVLFFNKLKSDHPDIPSFPVDDSKVKIPAAWLIQEAGYKGKRIGQTGTYQYQPLVLVNYGGGKAVDLLRLKDEIQAAVESKFGIELTPEVTII